MDPTTGWIDEGAVNNLFSGIPDALPREVSETLLDAGTLRVERIVSRGHVSPADFWYDQPENEWVLLLTGAAQISFDDGTVAALAPGDHLFIPAHRRHRVAWTDPEQNTVWLAIFFSP